MWKKSNVIIFMNHIVLGVCLCSIQYTRKCYQTKILN